MCNAQQYNRNGNENNCSLQETSEGKAQINKSEEEKEENKDKKQETNRTVIIVTEKNPEINQETSENDDLIIIGPKSVKTENRIIYKSKKEYIREYSIYGLIGLCVFMIIVLLINKKSLEESKKNG